MTGMGAMGELEEKKLRSAFGAFLTGVTVVTSRTDDLNPIGFTANSFTSVSLDPPILLVCLARQMSCHSVFEKCDSFAVNILAEHQQDISDTFARFRGDRFADLDWRESSLGNPLINGVSAWFDCTIHQRIDAGDHLVIMGQVKDYGLEDTHGLGYSRGGYFRIGLEQQASELQAREKLVSVGAIIQQNGSVLVFENENSGKYSLPETSTDRLQGTQGALQSMLETIGVPVEFGPIYSIFEDENTGKHSLFYRAHTDQAVATGNARFIPLALLQVEKFNNPAIATMMRRYVAESRENLFGIYYGTDRQGRVEQLSNKRS